MIELPTEVAIPANSPGTAGAAPKLTVVPSRGVMAISSLLVRPTGTVTVDTPAASTPPDALIVVVMSAPTALPPQSVVEVRSQGHPDIIVLLWGRLTKVEVEIASMRERYHVIKADDTEAVAPTERNE